MCFDTILTVWFNTTAGEVFNVYSTFNCDITNGSSNPDVVFSCQLARAVKVFSNLKAAVWRLNFVADVSDIS